MTTSVRAAGSMVVSSAPRAERDTLTAAVDQLAETLGIAGATLSHWLSATLQRLPYAHYYVFRAREGLPSRAVRRARTLAAFPTADDALAFAQRSGYGSRLRLRSFPASDLLVHMLADQSVRGLLFLPQAADGAPAHWGPVLRLRRGEIVELLRSGDPGEASPMAFDLSAQGYDALRFGVDFRDRARFRVALAVAVEHVVARYVPPAGSLDSGPRSIFATGAVEAWLRDNGFPHAHQRRWVDVAADPRYDGAAELFEIDAGTTHSLLVQLFIHAGDDGRQFIKRVNVTA